MIGRAGSTGRAGGPGPRRAGPGKVLAALSACLPWLASCADRPEEAPAARPAAGYYVDADYLKDFCVASGVDYPIVTEERTIAGANPGPADATIVGLYRATLAESMGIYARAFLAEAGLRRVVLCRNLAVDGTASFAFSDVEHGRLFLNLDAGTPDGFLRRTVHHEVFHFVDFAEDRRLDEDRPWSSLNPAGFLYGSGGGSMQQDSDAGRPVESLVGFVDRYATSGLAEDKAEVYACLVFDGPWMARRGSLDPILGRKAGRVRASLRRFGPLAPDLDSRAR